MDSNIIRFFEKETEDEVSDLGYLLWFKSCSTETWHLVHPVHVEDLFCTIY